MTRDRILVYSLLGNVLLLFLSGLFAWLYFTKPCPCYESGQTVIVHDTIYPKDTTLALIASIKPKPNKARRNPKAETKVVYIEREGQIIRDTITSACDSVYIYSDSLNKDDVKLVINDTVSNGVLSGRSIWLRNLKPTIKTTETVVRKEKVKLYIGASFSIDANNLKRWGVGPSALVTIPKIGGIAYTFDVKNFIHHGTLYALIRVKK